MSKDLKKTLIYSLVPAIILFILSSFISSWSGCEAGTLCFNPAQKYYGFPVHYVNSKLEVTNYLGMLVNFFMYYFASFTSLFILRLVIYLIHQKKHANS